MAPIECLLKRARWRQWWWCGRLHITCWENKESAHRGSQGQSCGYWLSVFRIIRSYENNKTKYFRLRRYDEVWLVSFSLIALWVLFKYSLSALCVLWVLSECLLGPDRRTDRQSDSLGSLVGAKNDYFVGSGLWDETILLAPGLSQETVTE